jgi:hypothetical protein
MCCTHLGWFDCAPACAGATLLPGKTFAGLQHATATGQGNAFAQHMHAHAATHWQCILAGAGLTGKAD